MAKRTSLLDTIAGAFVPIHQDGHKFVAISAVAALILMLISSTLGWLAIIITAWVAYFFRDPERVTPMRDKLVVSAADGEVSSIEEVTPPAELGLDDEKRIRVSVFLSVFDVHIQRAPVAGTIKRIVYSPGAFVNAALDKASEENERSSMVIESHDGTQIAVVQIAGLVARRIVSFVEDLDKVGRGERYGLIRFGSRVDIYLPPGKAPQVCVGQRAIAGETVICDLNSDEPLREARVS